MTLEPYLRREGSPPDERFFRGLWKPLGFRSAAIDLPDFSIRFDQMDQEWHEAFLARYAPYARDTTTDRGAFSLALSATRSEAVDHFIEPPPPGVAEMNPVHVAADPEAAPGHWRVRVCTHTLAASFSTSGRRGVAVFSRAKLPDYDPRERAVENVLRVATAWTALARGGLLLHSACIEKGGRAYVLFGPSGAGKSTISASSRRGRVISDDLTLLLPGAGGRPEAVGSPYRGTSTGGPVQGRFPVAAAFRLRKCAPGQSPHVEPLARREAMSDAIANLTFVVDQLPAHPTLFLTVESVLDAMSIQALWFRRDDDSWWEAIDSAGL